MYKLKVIGWWEMSLEKYDTSLNSGIAIKEFEHPSKSNEKQTKLFKDMEHD